MIKVARKKMTLESNQFQYLENLRIFGHFAGFGNIWSELKKISNVIYLRATLITYIPILALEN